MVVLIIGVPDSGKSELAERLAVEMAGGGKKLYVATMAVLDEDARKRVDKHRKQRDGKGFLTIEAQVNAGDAVADEPEHEEATALVECISNLVGNVMHDKEMNRDEEFDAVTAVTCDVTGLCKMVRNAVLVTNSFPKDGPGYDEDTRNYVRCLDEVNKRMQDVADVVYEFQGGEWVKSENN